jgi:hypothetical protein
MANTLRPVVFSGNVVTALTTTFQTIYTVPSATTFTVGMIHLFNGDSVNRGVYICLVPNAGSPVQSNGILWNFTISPQDVTELFKGGLVPANYTIQAKADTNSVVTLHISGIETT